MARKGSEELNDDNLEPIDKRKMFVGGLSLDTEEEDMKNYFSQYGEVMHAVVKRDPVSGRSRCFGFVTFANSTALRKVAEKREHLLKGRRIDPKSAEPRSGEEVIMKIFVGGIDPNMPDEDFRAYFEKYGSIRNIEWPRDRNRGGVKKNFAFVEYDDERSVLDCIKNPKQEVGGKMCDVRKAIPPQNKPMQGNQMMGMGMGDRGWGDLSGFGGNFGAGGMYDQYAAAAAMYGFGSAEQMAAYYQQFSDPSSFFDPSMAAYYGYGDGYASAFDYAAAAAGYGGDAMKRASLRSGSGGGGGGGSPRGGSGLGGRSGGAMSGSGGMSGRTGFGSRGGGTAGFHPYRR